MSQESSTKQLKQVLGFWDLMGTSLGTIIGAGIMTMLGSAIAMTGRSVPIAFLIAAIIVVFQNMPMLLVSGTVRLRGGKYTQVAMLAGEKFAGAFIIMHIITNLSLSMYAISFAGYFMALFGFGDEKIIALIILTIFFVLNCFGIDKFAKVQNIIIAFLVIALALFVAMGAGHVDPNYIDASSFMTGGWKGLFQAGALLTFAVGGSTCIINLSAEAKNPTRDIPIVMIVSTIIVAVIYGAVAIVDAGVLPVEQVAGQNLSVVANLILSKPLYIFFMICGAGCALISTLNATFAWAPKPVLQACDDGWLPKGLAKLSKYNTPIVILGILYALGVICIFTNLSISSLGNITLIADCIITLIIDISVCRIGKICPEAWNKSKFKVGRTGLIVISALGVIGAIINICLNASSLTPVLIVLNVLFIAGAFLFSFLRSRYVHMEISYEEVQ